MTEQEIQAREDAIQQWLATHPHPPMPAYPAPLDSEPMAEVFAWIQTFRALFKEFTPDEKAGDAS